MITATNNESTFLLQNYTHNPLLPESPPPQTFHYWKSCLIVRSRTHAQIQKDKEMGVKHWLNTSGNDPFILVV